VPSRSVLGKAMSILKSTAFGRKRQLRFADSNRLTDEPNFVGPDVPFGPTSQECGT
jgi:hypothetical protein